MGKHHFACAGSTALAGIGKALCGIILGLIVYTNDVAAATYFISPAGADSNPGVATTSPWLTFAYAMSRTSCGDTLIVKDGTYTTATNGSLVITNFACGVNNPFIVQAQNQRAALLQGDGSDSAREIVKITSSSYVTIDGLRVKSADNASASCCHCNILVTGTDSSRSTHVTLRNLIVSHNNRYQNTSLIRFYNTTNSLLEDTEIYSYQRHGAILSGNTSNNVMRRLYCNSRRYADIPGGYVSATSDRGESCAANYPNGGTINSDGNIFENIISEGSAVAYNIEAKFGPSNTKWLGLISLNDNTGMMLRARGDTLITDQPLNTIVKDVVVIKPIIGMRFLGNRNTQITNATVYNCTSPSFAGIWAEVEGTLNGSGTVSVFGTNILTTLCQIGFNITEQTAWTMTNPDAFSNTTNFSPASTIPNYVNPASTDPQMGTCLVWRPDGSAAKTNKWGADILYRYRNGVLTNVPLWNPTTGEFPHGALVAGVNDVAGQSLFDVHKRLNVNTNGCSFPANYGDGVTDVDAPSSPVGLRLF